ncbi:Glycosyl transferases group 1 [Burkholderia oklahomensis]|nr:glycosyl transferases group 1 family protein [Burkholderia oklahomensis C6786]SUW57326.1 Glycosyl transferases group 1 [Burkholderia oklahomensis]
MGGGEKYTGTIAQILSEGHEVDLIHTTKVDLKEFQARMNLDLSRVRWVEWPGDSCAQLAPRSADYDLFINSTYCSSMVSQAKKSMYVVFFPHQLSPRPMGPRRKALTSLLSAMGQSRWLLGEAGARLASRACGRLQRGSNEFISSYQIKISISQFTTDWLDRRWGCKGEVLSPPIDIERYADIEIVGKSRVILSVGRFFHGGKDGHNKKHLELLRAFRAMCDLGRVPDGWEYHLAGSVNLNTPDDIKYFQEVNGLAKGYPVKILGNISADALKQEYTKASIFWHGSGWGEDAESYPERMEHFGMTTCEAMAAACVPVVMPQGGQREIVDDGINGYYFRNADELIARTETLMAMFGHRDMEMLATRAREDVRRYSLPHFRKGIIDLVGAI